MIAKFPKRLCSNSHVRAACVVLGAVGAAHAQQTSERIVRVQQALTQTDAVMISKVTVAGKPIECGLFVAPPRVIQPVTPFQAGDDWLQQMTISLFNRTNRSIVSGGVMFQFLDTGDCHSVPCAGAWLNFGHIPEMDAYDGRTGQPLPKHPERPAIAWKPEQTIVVHVSDYMAQIEQALANFVPVSAVTKMNVYPTAFYFEDGTRWTDGGFSVPDGDRPGRFKYLPAGYFPGDKRDNWPPGYHE